MTDHDPLTPAYRRKISPATGSKPARRRLMHTLSPTRILSQVELAEANGLVNSAMSSETEPAQSSGRSLLGNWYRANRD